MILSLSAAFSQRSCTTSVWPSRQAAINGVCPPLLAANLIGPTWSDLGNLWQPESWGECCIVLLVWGRQQITLQEMIVFQPSIFRCELSLPCIPIFRETSSPHKQSHSHFPPWFLQIGAQLTQDLPDKKNALIFATNKRGKGLCRLCP